MTFQQTYGVVKDAALKNALVPARELMTPTRRRDISELPAKPKVMLHVALVLTFSLMGLSDDDIALMCGTTTEQVERVRAQEAYKQSLNEIIAAAKEHGSDTVSQQLQEMVPDALTAMRGALASDSEWIKVAAAKDVLDRSGYSPKQTVEHKHTVDGGLRIEYVDKTDKLDDITPVVIENGE